MREEQGGRQRLLIADKGENINISYPNIAASEYNQATPTQSNYQEDQHAQILLPEEQQIPNNIYFFGGNEDQQK